MKFEQITTSESLKAMQVFIFQHFSFCERLKEVLAIMRIFSLVDMITNMKFTKLPNFFKIDVV